MLESLSTSPLVTGTITAGAVVAALVVIWTKVVKPFAKWVSDAVKNFQRIGNYLERLVSFFEGGLFERMIDFLEREREEFRSDIEEVKRQNAEGVGVHEELDRRLRIVERTTSGPGDAA